MSCQAWDLEHTRIQIKNEKEEERDEKNYLKTTTKTSYTQIKPLYPQKPTRSPSF